MEEFLGSSMKKIKNIQGIIDKYKYLNISTIADEAYDNKLSIYRTCIEFESMEIENLFYREAINLNKLDVFEKYEAIYLNILYKIYNNYNILCFKYHRWPGNSDNSIELFEMSSFDEFEVLCKKGLREKYFFGFLIDEIGLIFCMNFDLIILFFYYEQNREIAKIESMFVNEHFLITRY